MLAALVVTTYLNSQTVLSHMLTWFGAGNRGVGRAREQTPQYPTTR